MDGIKKAALFLSGLECSTVDTLLNRLDADLAKAIRREMMALEKIPLHESNRIAEEFVNTVVGTQTASRRGWDVEHHLTSPKMAAKEYGTYSSPKPQTSPRFSTAQYGMAQPVANSPLQSHRRATPFDFLGLESPESIADELGNEHPQTIALVLAQLSPAQAGEILGYLPTAMQFDVAERLTDYEGTDELVSTEIAAMLRVRFEKRKTKAQKASAIKVILKSADPTTQRRILSKLEPESEIRTFEQLEELTNQQLSQLFHSIAPETTMLALIGAKPSFIERVVERFAPTKEYELRHCLTQLGPIGPADIAAARAAVLKRANR